VTTKVVSEFGRPGMTRIRPRMDDDWPALLELWVASWRIIFPDIDFDARRDWLTRQIKRLEGAGALTLCLEELAPASLAGFVVIDPVSGWLDQICIEPSCSGKGYGDKLLLAACEFSPGLVQLDVNAENLRAIRFYERNGFIRIGAGNNPLSGRPTIKMEWRQKPG
jgi:putative acetyltransferase